MGFNTSVVILNDCLGSISEDKDIGKRIADAVHDLSGRRRPIDVRAGNALQAVRVIETHHASSFVPILVGGNCGFEIRTAIPSDTHSDDMETTLLRRLADKHGYALRKKATRR